jgi:peptide deformylase
MSVKPILKMGEPSLLQKAKEVKDFGSPELLQLLEDMKDTMANANGAGLAAPQIGVDLQVVIFGTDQINPRYPDAELVPKTVLINPKLEYLNDSLEDLEMGWEGCLSVPGMRGLVPRYQHLKYSGFDEWGNAFSRQVSGFHARVVQHECDHLLGILYPMRMKDMSQFGFVDVLFPELDPHSDD